MIALIMRQEALKVGLDLSLIDPKRPVEKNTTAFTLGDALNAIALENHSIFTGGLSPSRG